MTGRPIALIDIDGVLANDIHRTHFAIDKEWAEYFAEHRMYADTVWPEGRALAERLMVRGTEVAYLTGRREDRREVTVKWLKDNGLPFGPLYMRPAGIKIRLAELKALRIEDLRRRYPERHIVLYDDDPEVIDHVRDLFGEDSAVHCTWYTKPEALVRRAVA